MEYVWRTIAYFAGWGYVLGALGGFLVIWIINPGSLIGSRTTASGVGLFAGGLVGLIMGIIQEFTFHRDMDLVAYRRLAVLGIGPLFGIASTVIFILTVETLSGLNFLVALALTVLWTSLTGGFLTHHYVMWRASLVLSTETISPENLIYSEAIKLWWDTRLKYWLYGILAISTLFVVTTTPQPDPLFPDWGSMSVLAPVVFLALWLIGASIAIWAFSLFQSAPLLILKELVFNEYRPLDTHKTRLTLTFMSFVWSLVLCWWMIYLAPLLIIVPLITTYYVYHSIALLNDESDKAKRKEKISEELVSSEGEPA